MNRLIEHGARRFRGHRLAFGHGLPNARDEAAYLVRHALELSGQTGAGPSRGRLGRAVVDRVIALFERRIHERKPAAYLTHEAWLGGVKFFVDERALVPRSFITNLLRDALVPWIPDARAIRSALDLCTGSGCLAVLLAHAFPQAKVDAVDNSPDALAVARINVKNHRLARRIRLTQSDLFSALRGRRYDLIVSNPPYVRTAVMRRLPREYRSEPVTALAGGDDGLALVRPIIQTARRHLNPGGILVVEIGHNRPRLECAYPRIAFTWPDTSGTDDCVFLLSRDQLPVVRRNGIPKVASGSARRRHRAGTSARA